MLIDEIVSFCNSQCSHADTEHILKVASMKNVLKVVRNV